MPNSIERDVYVLRDTLKNPISYVRGTDLLPIILHFRDFTIPSGATAKVFVSKNDGNAVYGGATITGNDVTVDVTQQMFITLGVNLMQVEIDSGDETLITFEQPVMVTPNLKAGDLPESTTDVDFIDKIIDQAQEAVNNANQAVADANTAISGANTAASSANAAAENANNAAENLQDKVDAGDFTASVQVGATTTLDPDQDATVSNSGTSKDAVLNFGIPKGDPGTAATIQVGTTQTVQPEENAEVTNTGTASAAVLNFKIPRGEDGMTDLTAEYKDASEYTCQPTVNAPVVVKELDGKTDQTTTNGYQLFDASKLPTKTQGGVTVTNNGDGSFTISGSGTISGDFRQNYSDPNIVNKLKVGNIYLITGKATYPYVEIQFKNSQGTVIKQLTSYPNASPSASFTEEEVSQVTNYEAIIWATAGQTVTPGTIKPMLYQDGDGTWEPYTGGSPAPSPDYPQDITGVGGKAGGSDFSTEVETQGRNLFDASKISTKTQGGATVTNNNDGSFTIGGSGAMNDALNIKYQYTHEETVKILKSGNIFLKDDIVTTCPLLQIYLQTDSGAKNELINSIAGSKTSNVLQETLNDESCVLVLQFYGSNGQTIVPGTIKPMVYQDGDGTYQPYHHTALTIPLTSPLYEGDKICYVKPGESYVNADGEMVTADGVLYGCYRENAIKKLTKDIVNSTSGGVVTTNDIIDGRYTAIQCNNYQNIINKALYNNSTLTVGKCNIAQPGKVNDWNINSGGDSNIYTINDAGAIYIATDISFLDGITTSSTKQEVNTAVKNFVENNDVWVTFKIAQPYFEPFADQSIFYDLRTDDTLTYIYSNDPINPNVTVEVAKNSTGGYLLESYAQAQKNAISEANSQSRISAIEQQLVNQATTPTE